MRSAAFWASASRSISICIRRRSCGVISSIKSSSRGADFFENGDVSYDTSCPRDLNAYSSLLLGQNLLEPLLLPHRRGCGWSARFLCLIIRRRIPVILGLFLVFALEPSVSRDDGRRQGRKSTCGFRRVGCGRSLVIGNVYAGTEQRSAVIPKQQRSLLTPVVVHLVISLYLWRKRALPMLDKGCS